LHRIAEHGTGVEEQKRSSLALITSLLHRIQTRPTIQREIQREMAVDQKSLNDTAAGQVVLCNIYQLRLHLASQVADARPQMQDAMQAQDLQAAQHLQDFKLQCAAKIDDAQQQQEELKTLLMELHDRETSKLQSKLERMTDEQSTALRRKEQELRNMQESLRVMRTQSAVGEARWKRQRLHARELEKKRRDARKMNEACEQDVAALKQEVVQDQEALGEINKTKGIIYLHRISDVRMQASAKKNLFMFKKLCGDDALKNVILATTMWDRMTEADGTARELELTSTPDFWGVNDESRKQGVATLGYVNSPT
jgi:hypothetical protein